MMRSSSGTQRRWPNGSAGLAKQSRGISLLLALVLLALTACIGGGGNGGSGGGGGGGRITYPADPTSSEPGSGTLITPRTETPASTADEGCSAQWPRVFPLRTEDESLSQYLDDIKACWNPQTGSVTLTNNSDQVWVFRHSAGAPLTITPVAQKVEAEEFHLLAASLYQYAFMTPGEQVSYANDTGTLSWAIHPELSAAWIANEFLLDELKKRGEAALKAAYTRDSASRNAVWTCTRAVYNVGIKVPEAITSPDYDPSQLLTAGLGTATSTGECARAWRAAELEVGTARVAPWSQVADELGTALQPAAQLDERLGNLKKAVRATVPLICKTLGRNCGPVNLG